MILWYFDQGVRELWDNSWTDEEFEEFRREEEVYLR